MLNEHKRMLLSNSKLFLLLRAQKGKQNQNYSEVSDCSEGRVGWGGGGLKTSEEGLGFDL